MTPFDAGMGNLVKFNHDFIGREALEKIAANPRRDVCVLEWNSEDVGKVFAAMLEPGSDVDDITKRVDMDYPFFNSFKSFPYRRTISRKTGSSGLSLSARHASDLVTVRPFALIGTSTSSPSKPGSGRLCGMR